MFCCTFYSYKGGVGRTLALANVAIQHAKKGKRVLTVDFDLEAPGLSTLTPFDQAGDRAGLIDFVRDYQSRREVPKAKSYIYPCHFHDGSAEYQVDVMPAGCGEQNYSEAFSSIDWNELYEEQNGFLLMEDLRAQWQKIGYDYVFIDSRTGHTDSGGICTRQLPDAVAIVFFPNAQNLRGLLQTVPGIRTSEGRPHPIETLFVASRVPRLDDEHGLLSGLLHEFQKGLRYAREDMVLIEQYDSLSLLDQELFVLTRPTSGLAKQYIQLATKISQLNIEDPDGAIAYLRTELQAVRRRPDSAATNDQAVEVLEDSPKLNRIGERHENDALVQSLLARLYYARRSIVDAAIASDKALSAKQKTRASEKLQEHFLSSVHHLRLRIFSELDLSDTVVRSATAIIKSERAQDTAILDALMALANFAPEKLPSVDKLPVLERADAKSLLSLAKRLMWTPEATEVAAVIIERVLTNFPQVEYGYADLTDLQLPLISTGRFELAFKIFENAPFVEEVRLDVLFNSAMAKWGRDGTPDIEMFNEILPRLQMADRKESGANHNECRSLVEGVLGLPRDMQKSLKAAHKDIEEGGHIEFSCWNFRNVPVEEFREHLRAIERFILHDGPPPAFLKAGPRV